MRRIQPPRAFSEKAGQQAPRNTHMARILRDYGLMDDRGMDIRRKVIPLMKEWNGL